MALDFNLLSTNMPAEAASSAMKGMQQVNALTTQRLANQASGMEIQNALAEQEAWKGSATPQEAQQNLMRGGFGKSAMAIGKNIADVEKTQMEAKKVGLESTEKGMSIMRERTKDLLGNPSNENYIAHIQEGLRDGLITPEQAQRSVQTYTAIPPNQRVAYLTQQLAKAEKIYETNVISAADQARINISQGHLNLARENAVSPESQALISKAILDGRLDPNKVNSRNRNIIASTLMANPTANLKQLGEDAASGLSSARTIGTQEANVSMAASEARKMITIANDYSAKVDRTQYPSINAISNAVSKGTGDANIVQLNTALNSLVNVYARAINPKGVATVSDKNHARELINAAYSSGQLSGIFDVMDQEMAAAQVSGKEARKAIRGESKLPAGVGNDWVLKTDAKGNKAYVSPDNSKFVEVK